MMVIMSLRASWLQNVQEEKVYHDESEMAENMILDEHEEYLAYISKYKHEWQEYRGFDERPISPNMGANGDADGSYSTGSYSDEEYTNDDAGYNSLMESCDEASEVSNMAFQVTVVPTESTRDSCQSTDEVSLPDLDMMASTTQSIVEEDPKATPAHMLPAPGNPDFRRGPSQNAYPSTLSTLENRISKSEDVKYSSGGFFEKYGIAPGASVRNKATTKSGNLLDSKRDPPGTVPHSTLASPFNSAPVVAARSQSRHRMGQAPSSRVFFKAETAVDDEVEIHLIHQRSSHSRYTEDDIYEC
jgi:hypothetical protein